MSSPQSSHYDSAQLRSLASAAMDGTADEMQLKVLADLLKSSLEARDEYLAFVDQHAFLATELSGRLSVADHLNPNGMPGSQGVAGGDEEARIARNVEAASDLDSRRRWLQFAGLATLAASLLIAITQFTPLDPIAPNPGPIAETFESKSFATIAQLNDAVWQFDSLSVGDRIGSTTLKLESGFARLQFDSGVEVTLEGPAEYRIVTASRTQLMSGLLAATVADGAEGFTVSTPTAEIVDLGTSFGIDLREDGFSSVTVFDGEVEVASLGSSLDPAVKQLLTEGESVRIGSNAEIEKISFDSQPFERLWPIASGIAGSTNTIRFVPPWPRRIRFVQSDNEIFLATEARSMELRDGLTVNISEPGDYVSEAELTPHEFQAGERVRSYILHYSPATQLGPRRARRIVGSVTFDRPIRGAIVLHDDLLASSRRFTRRSAGEENHRRELNLTGDEVGDRVKLSDDRRTLTVELTSPGRSSDLMRVIVDGRRPLRPRGPPARN